MIRSIAVSIRRKRWPFVHRRVVNCGAKTAWEETVPVAVAQARVIRELVDDANGFNFEVECQDARHETLFHYVLDATTFTVIEGSAGEGMPQNT